MTKFIDYYSKNINQYSKPLEECRIFIWAKKNNISLAVCTNKQEKLAIDLLKKLNMYKYFEYVAGSDTFHLINLIQDI